VSRYGDSVIDQAFWQIWNKVARCSNSRINYQASGKVDSRIYNGVWIRVGGQVGGQVEDHVSNWVSRLLDESRSTQ
jgi:hypothetical protein